MRGTSRRSLLAPILLAALAGATNAALCWLQWPVAIPDTSDAFRWHLVPAGAWHGGVLAAVALLGAERLRGRSWVAALLAGPVLGWIAGYFSWLPIAASIDTDRPLASVLAWAFDGWDGALLSPLQSFGLVSWLFLWALAWLDRAPRPAWAPRVAGVLAGALGSLWFWFEMERFYLSLLHGAIWGLLASQSAGTSLNHSRASARSTLPPLSTAPTRLPATSRTPQ